MHMIVHVIECDTSLVQHAHAQVGNYKRYMILTYPACANSQCCCNTQTCENHVMILTCLGTKGILSPPAQLHSKHCGLGSSTQNRARSIPYRLVRAPLSQLSVVAAYLWAPGFLRSRPRQYTFSHCACI